MTQCILGWRNRFEEGVLSAGSQVASAPVTNLVIPQGSEPWLTAAGVMTSAAGAWAQIDAGAPVTWRIFCLARTNLSTGAMVRWRLGTTPGDGDVMDSGSIGGVVAGVNQHVYTTAQELTARYLRVDIDDSNVDGQIMIGLAFAGPGLQPGISFDWPSTEGMQDRTDRTQTVGGQVFNQPQWQQRNMSIQFNGLRDAEVRDSLKEADRYGRNGGNVLWIPDPDADPMQDAILGEITDPAQFSWPFVGNADVRAWRATFLERL